MNNHPPRLAVLVLALLASRADRDALTGDMMEEFTQRNLRSANDANIWYWKQTFLSAPHLLWRKLSSAKAKKYAIGLFVSFISFGLVCVWDIFLARNAVQLFVDAAGSQSLISARIIYFCIMTLGLFVGGALVAIATFCPSDSFGVNVRRFLLPASIAVLGPYIYAVLISDRSSATYMLVWLAVGLPSLLTGAKLASLFRTKPVF